MGHPDSVAGSRPISGIGQTAAPVVPHLRRFEQPSIVWVCCNKGFQAPRMAAGVGRATMESVVMCFVPILVWDYFMTSVMLLGG
jgi:hypothetical protein